MNVIAATFRELITTLRVTPESHRADDLCRELMTWLAHLPNRYALVAFIHQGNLEPYRWYDGAVKFLSLHGIYLLRREHSQGKGWFVYVHEADNHIGSADDLHSFCFVFYFTELFVAKEVRIKTRMLGDKPHDLQILIVKPFALPLVYSSNTFSCLCATQSAKSPPTTAPIIPPRIPLIDLHYFLS